MYRVETRSLILVLGDIRMIFQREVLWHYKEFETLAPVGLGDGCTV